MSKEDHGKIGGRIAEEASPAIFSKNQLEEGHMPG